MLFQFACLIGCGNNQKPQELQLKPHIIKIAIEYQNLDIETPIRIDCKNFNTYFNNNIKVRQCQLPRGCEAKKFIQTHPRL